MISNYGYIDGSWKLKIVSEDLNGIVLITVFNNTNLGELSTKIAEYFNMKKNQLKNFGLWCPSRNSWLLKTELTLHQLSLNANSTLFFTKKHKEINVQLTNKLNRKITVDFSVPFLHVIKDICTEFELENFHIYSLVRYRRISDGITSVKPKTFNNKLSKSHLTASLRNLTLNYPNQKRISKNLGSNFPWTPTSGYGSLSSNVNSLENFHGSCSSINTQANYNHTNKQYNDSHLTTFSTYQPIKSKTNSDRSKLNKEWIYLSKSLMEQNIMENSSLIFKIKSLSINFEAENISDDLLDLLYEQFKDSILSGEIELELNLALILAALQYNIYLAEKQYHGNSNGNLYLNSRNKIPLSFDEAIDRMLYSLEKELLIISEEFDEQFSIRTDHFVGVHQIIPIKSSGKFLRMKLKLIKDQIKIFKENDFSQPKYEFGIKNCKFCASFRVDPDANSISWMFDSNRKLAKIETKFYNDEDFLSIYSNAVAHSNFWRPTLRQISDCEKVARKLLEIFRCSDKSEYNIFNMPRVELVNLLGCRVGKKEQSGKYLKTILQYHQCFTALSSRKSKTEYIRFCLNLPRFNYHYFYVKIHEPKDETGLTVVAVNEEMCVVLDADYYSIAKHALPWASLRSWKFNTELNQLDLYFRDLFISFTTQDCSAICFHEFISTFIWFASTDKSLDKADRINELISLINIKT